MLFLDDPPTIRKVMIQYQWRVRAPRQARSIHSAITAITKGRIKNSDLGGDASIPGAEVTLERKIPTHHRTLDDKNMEYILDQGSFISLI